MVERADVLEAWRAAWNACDADALTRLADDEIELVTPLGVRQGLSALRDLVAQQRFGVRLYVGPQADTFKATPPFLSDRSSGAPWMRATRSLNGRTTVPRRSRFATVESPASNPFQTPRRRCEPRASVARHTPEGT